ncbi:MAG: PQQ-like beta-propeller repeat protein [Planctomycetia bacterium]|nr:PQQ-like beta-propeller repeat protein [Planctomycetia bacterium]
MVLFQSRIDAADWSRFRGPNGCGQAADAGLPSKWTERDYAWQAPLDGAGNSSPIVSGSRVIITSADAKTATLKVFCLNLQTGARQWQVELAGAPYPMHLRNSFATSTPAADDRNAYVTWASPQHYQVAALDLKDGHTAWKVDLGPFSAQHGFGASPIVYRDRLIVPNDQDGESFIVALNTADGTQAWKTPRRSGRASYSTPCVFESAGRPAELIFTSSDNGMSGLDPQTGRQNWSLDLFPERTVGSPVAAGGLIFANCGQGGGGKFVVAVRPGATPDQPAKLEYEIKKGAPYVTTPIAHGDLLFLWHDRGTVSCHELATGKLVWGPNRVGGNYSGSPVLVGDRLYAISESGEVMVIAAGREYKLLGQTALGQGSRATPAVADGRMLLRTESKLFCLGGPAPAP